MSSHIRILNDSYYMIPAMIEGVFGNSKGPDHPPKPHNLIYKFAIN